MQRHRSTINIVRIGSDITFSSLREIGSRILDSLQGIIDEFELSHLDAPVLESIDAYLLTTILHDEFGGHTLGITDADLRTEDKDEFYSSIFGGKNPQNDVAVVSTRRLGLAEITSKGDYDLYIDRTAKVSLHEVGHNLGLTDHGSYKVACDGSLCPMTKGEFNRFGYWGYVRAIIDGRGMCFCDECAYFLRKVYGCRVQSAGSLEDGPEQRTC
jgi:predicted Zn-dependent protease